MTSFKIELIQQFDPGHWNTHLDGHDDAINGGVDRFKSAGGGKYGLWLAEQAHCQPCNDPKRAFRADKEMRKIIAGRGFSRPRSSFDYRAVGLNNF